MKYLHLLLIVMLSFLGACARTPASTAPAIDLPSVTPETPADPNVISPMAITLNAGELTMTIESPADNTTVTVSPIELRGFTNVESVLTVNGELYVLAGAQEFSIPVVLEEGYNSIELVASDLYANQVELILTIVYEIPEV